MIDNTFGLKKIALHCDGSLENIILRMKVAKYLLKQGYSVTLLCDSQAAHEMALNEKLNSYDLSRYDGRTIDAEEEKLILSWLKKYYPLDIHFLFHTHHILNQNNLLDAYSYHYQLTLSRLLGVMDVHQQEVHFDAIWDFAGDEIYHSTVRVLANASQANLLAYREAIYPDRNVLLSNEYLTFQASFDTIQNIIPSENEKKFVQDFFTTYFDKKAIFWGAPKLREKNERSKILKRFFEIKPKKIFNKNRFKTAYNVVIKSLRKKTNQLLYSKNTQDLANYKYVYFPFHYPLDSQLVFRGKPFTNQIALVELLIHLLPYNYRIVLKEHPHARGSISYQDLKRLKKNSKVILMDPFVNSHDILENATSVIIINSTVGAESLYQGKPVINLGMNYLRGSGLTIDIESLYDLPSVLSTIENHTVDRNLLEKFFTYFYRESYPISSGKILRNELSDDEIVLLSESIAKNVPQTS